MKSVDLWELTISISKRMILECNKKGCPKTNKMPVLFVGHGSPMNALGRNPFTESWKNLAKELPKPSAILSISAHWETQGTHVTASQYPQTIHDLGGFPKALFDVQYPAQGSPELAHEIKNMVESEVIHLSESWGLDHGTWSILTHLYPKAHVRVLQLSIDYYKTPHEHFAFAKELVSLRRKEC